MHFQNLRSAGRKGFQLYFFDTYSAMQSQSGLQDLTVTHSYMTVNGDRGLYLFKLFLNAKTKDILLVHSEGCSLL